MEKKKGREKTKNNIGSTDQKKKKIPRRNERKERSEDGGNEAPTGK